MELYGKTRIQSQEIFNACCEIDKIIEELNSLLHSIDNAQLHTTYKERAAEQTSEGELGSALKAADIAQVTSRAAESRKTTSRALKYKRLLIALK